MTIVALIPARAGSKRCPGKNTRLLGGKPLIAWTIEAAKESGIFSAVIVCTDAVETMAIAESWGASSFTRVPAGDDEPDIVWVRAAMSNSAADAFAILRPTSPFRTADTIRRAWQKFQDWPRADSLRAVEPVRHHPAKTWALDPLTGYIRPLLIGSSRDGRTPLHSCPTQTLPPGFYAQNASLEIAHTSVLHETETISGYDIVPFMTEGDEGFDINDELDWIRAEAIIASRQVPA